MGSRVKKLVAVSLATALLLELTLQAGYLALWLWYPRHADLAVRAGDRVVLCIGDSYTYGMGASTRAASYPAQLERILREELADRWCVVNDGWPGRASREALQRLDDNLRRYRPELVYVIIGTNDRHVRPEALVLPRESAVSENDSGFELKWRTGKLLALFAAVGEAEQSTHADIGKGADAGPRADDPWRHEAEGDHDSALAIYRTRLRSAAAGSQAEAECHRHIARILAKAGDPTGAGAAIDWLRNAYARAPSEDAAVRLLRALCTAKRDREALELAQALRVSHPRNADILCDHAALSLRRRDHEQAKRSIERAVELDPDNPRIWTTRRSIYWMSDPVEATRSAVRSYAISGGLQQAKWMVGLRDRVSDEVFTALCAELIADRDARAALHALWTQDDRDEGRDRAALVWLSHLRQIVERTRRAGATPVLATYPHRNPFPAELTALRRDTGVTVLDLHAEFRRARRAAPTVELFAGDGHCNDAGYRLMADLVARDAVSRVGS